jgi:hypothetical protein
MTTWLPLFRTLIDDAAVFPPAQTALAAAVKAHREHRSSWYSPLVGPFLCKASALDDVDALARDGEALGITIVADTGVQGLLPAVDAVAGTDRLRLQGVEIALRGEPLSDNARRVTTALDASLGGPDDDEPAYIEVPREHGWESALDVVAESGYRAKLRTGGPDAPAYPSPAELAEFIRACLDRGVAFKLTAGLHRAVRHTTSGGQAEHGFLNVALAVNAALRGGEEADIAVLEETDPALIADRVRELTATEAVSIRQWFASYGSCSIDEPLADLIDLELVSRTH